MFAIFEPTSAKIRGVRDISGFIREGLKKLSLSLVKVAYLKHKGSKLSHVCNKITETFIIFGVI